MQTLEQEGGRNRGDVVLKQGESRKRPHPHRLQVAAYNTEDQLQHLLAVLPVAIDVLAASTEVQF